MNSQFTHTTGLTKFIIIVEFTLVAYLIYSLTRNVYNSYLVDRYIETFEQENVLIAEENRKKTEDYLYFTSEEYIDKIAKQNLGLINSGEEVIIISPESLSYDTGASVEEILDEDGEDVVRLETSSNPESWWDFFFR
ncbi:MAG: septum formation initiator family protein [Candidatus Gracilibacteria bacterium]